VRRRGVWTVNALCCAAFGAWPVPAGAQHAGTAELRLTLLDATTGTRITGAEVAVLPGGTRAISADGVVVLRALALGMHHLTIQAEGYVAWQDSLRVERPIGGAATVLLEPVPIPLDPITASARARLPHLERAGFYSRMASDFGHFVERTAIERRDPATLLDMLYSAPSSQVVNVRGRRFFVLRRTGRQCHPALYLDGVWIRDPAFLEQIRPETVEAFELYVGMATPLQFRKDPCGALIIWTRK
jgi:hypothetical protein